MRKNINAEFADAIKKGRAIGLAKVANKLMDKALGGDTASIIFFLKTQGGWKEKQEVDITSGGSALPVMLNVVFDDDNETEKDRS